MHKALKSLDYRNMLWDQLESRRLRNPHYSQRAFARDLGMRSGRLSEILNGKQGLSFRYAKLVAERLELSTEESAYFTDLVILAHGRSAKDKKAAGERVEGHFERVEYRSIEVDQFQFISEWYHLAILELTKVKGFKASASWIAKRLEVPERSIKEALARLERLSFVRREKGKYVVLQGDNQIPGGVASKAIKLFHAQLLEKAKTALSSQPLEKREFVSLVLSLDPSRLPEAKARIAEFWRAMDQEFGGSTSPTEVYSLGVQFFQLTGTTENE